MLKVKSSENFSFKSYQNKNLYLYHEQRTKMMSEALMSLISV